MQNIYSDISSPILPVQRQTNEQKFVTSGGHCVIPPKIYFSACETKRFQTVANGCSSKLLSSKEVGQYLVITAKRSPNLKHFFEERIISH